MMDENLVNKKNDWRRIKEYGKGNNNFFFVVLLFVDLIQFQQKKCKVHFKIFYNWSWWFISGS